MPESAPYISAPAGPTKPEPGVMVASPAIAPVAIPTKLDLPNLTYSIKIQTKQAVAAEMCITVIARPAFPSAARAEPALKPNQPTPQHCGPNHHQAGIMRWAELVWKPFTGAQHFSNDQRSDSCICVNNKPSSKVHSSEAFKS